MASVELVLRLVLVVVFATAGAAKLLDLKASRDTVVAFGMPEGVAALLGTGLPVAELFTAIALLPTVTARWGSLAAIVLLATFTAGVGYALSQGRTPDCNCFGQVSSEQISSRTLLRNGGLIVIAAVSLWRAPGSSLSGWTGNLNAANLVASLGVLMLALATVLVFHSRQLLASVRADLASAGTRPAKPGLQPGEVAPDFELPVLGGQTSTLTALLERRIPAVLVFASQTCAPCREMLPELVRWSETLEERLAIALVEGGVQDRAALSEEIAQHGTILTLLDDGGELAAAYEVAATPTAVLIGSDGRIAAHQTSGGGNIEDLVRSALESPEAAPGALVA
jgi:uncharacterized membrane protein YphA (DoxX/SURF4 family)/peroxiredoxin